MITIKESNNFIKINGHANYDKYGKDIVCASVSCVVITTLNACLKINTKSIDYEQRQDTLLIEVLSNKEVIKKLIKNMMDLLEELASSYPKNVKVERLDND